jgi:hypothetical protein
MRAKSVITFKVDPALDEALRQVENRSEFIRAAVVAALSGACPLCHGTGLLTAGQRKHWEDFILTHDVRQCGDCHGTYIECHAEETGK